MHKLEKKIKFFLMGKQRIARIFFIFVGLCFTCFLYGMVKQRKGLSLRAFFFDSHVNIRQTLTSGVIFENIKRRRKAMAI